MKIMKGGIIMEKIIKITGFSNKPKNDKTGTFPCFEIISSGEQMSIGVFENEVVDVLKKQIDQWVKVIMATRPNGYKNITHYIGLAKPEEIPSDADIKPEEKDINNSNNRKMILEAAEKISDNEFRRSEYQEALNSIPKNVLPHEAIVRYIHEVITDTRKNSMECGKAGERVKIYFDKIDDFAKQYEEVIQAKRLVDSRIFTDNDKK